MNDVTFGKMLASVMLDNKYDRFVKNRKTGKLDTRGLYRIETSSKLFKKREARKNKHYAVSLVVDVSGSMAGQKINVAAEAANRLSRHLAGIGIPHNIVAFAGHIDELKPFDDKYDKQIGEKLLAELYQSKNLELCEKYHRYIAWDEGVKAFKNKMGFDVHPTFGSMTEKEVRELRTKCSADGIRFTSSNSSSYNSDGEAVAYVREMILKKQGRRIVILLSDGAPCDVPDCYESPIHKGKVANEFNLKREISKTVEAGVELYSIGVLSDAVNRFYPARRTCSISKLDALYPHIIKLVRLNLKRG